ncbi:hypothetical protein DPX16_14794 [Anabarilius grahami]|uniref:CCHC-type domain-containing protein n=1 Tax=Anabarilius grahami TaxID=495550 RepID=A0A3N0YA35_ANAGA|nr:hypothetical protein DPX16_14794 [Anabarilius grahami]
MEAAADQAKKMISDRGVSDKGLPVQTVHSRSHKTANKQYHRSSKPHAAATSSPRRSCFRCGSDKHLANSTQCPAANAQCKSCNKRGHFASVCRSVPTSKVHEVQLPDVTILYTGNTDEHAPKRLFCNATIHTPASAAQEIRLTVDTGSAVSILPHHVYKQYFSSTPLFPPSARLVTYTQTHIPVLGCLHAQVCVADSSTPGTFFVVEEVYRATPHATTSTSPYELLYGRKMRTRLDILPIAPMSNSSDIHDSVERKQAKMKQYTDIKRHARTPSFAQGERVRVRIPRLVPKAHSRFSAPLTVEKRSRLRKVTETQTKVDETKTEVKTVENSTASPAADLCENESDNEDVTQAEIESHNVAIILMQQSQLQGAVVSSLKHHKPVPPVNVMIMSWSALFSHQRALQQGLFVTCRTAFPIIHLLDSLSHVIALSCFVFVH